MYMYFFAGLFRGGVTTFVLCGTPLKHGEGNFNMDKLHQMKINQAIKKSKISCAQE